VPSLTTTRDEILARMLRRLPPSLWDNSPLSDTLQRDLYRAIAGQCAVWLEQRDIARTMTLMLEAQGLDLDTLLQDYGLKRYLQRPDAYARQIGMHILWTPKGSRYSIANLADLLFDPQPHVTLRTGRNHLHVFLANTQDVTTPYSYWGLVSQQGLWYAVTVDADVPTISTIPPPGLDISPGLPTLHWFTVLDATSALWYVTIDGDTLALSQTQPAGTGTTEPFSVLDGQGNVWHLSADAGSQALVTTLETGLPGFGYWRLRDPLGTVYAVWIEGDVPTVNLTPPAGSDQTPGGTPLAWVQVLDERGNPAYISIAYGTLFVAATAPGGTGTDALWEVLDAAGQRWVITAQSGENAVVTTAARPFNADLVVISPDAHLEAMQLFDSAGIRWWLSVDATVFRLTSTLPQHATDVTPPGGPFRWLRAYNLAGAPFFLFPDLTGVLNVDVVSPGGAGTLTPRTFGDAFGVRWHYGIDPAGNAALSNTPPVDYGGMATAVCLHDALGARWFWRVHGFVLEWSAVLWPDTLDQSPWGDLGWLQVTNEDGAIRYLFPTPQGDPMATSGPPPASPWGWQDPLTLLDLDGTRWAFTVFRDDRIGITTLLPEDIPAAETPLNLREAQEAFGHIQDAGTLVTVLMR
jgi:hypothetical protein